MPQDHVKNENHHKKDHGVQSNHSSNENRRKLSLPRFSKTSFFFDSCGLLVVAAIAAANVASFITFTGPAINQRGVAALWAPVGARGELRHG